MDDYQHLRESADETATLNQLRNLGIRFGHHASHPPYTLDEYETYRRTFPNSLSFREERLTGCPPFWRNELTSALHTLARARR